MAWEMPPPIRRGTPGVLTAEVEAILRAVPGEWIRLHYYKYASGASSAAKSMRSGKWPGIDPAEWEAEARKNGSGSVLYVRFTGPRA